MPDPSRTEASEYHLEIELKLAGTPADLAAAWKALKPPEAKEGTKNLVSTYFDTADRHLKRRGFTLRVRRQGQRFTQTLKSEGAGRPLSAGRGEWSLDLEGPYPDPQRMGDAEVRERIGLVLPGELAPLFATEVTRRYRRYDCPGPAAARIELAWDSGAIVCGKQREAISEVEFELMAGAPEALYREAARYHAERQLRFETQSKSTRGFALCDGEAASPRKAGAVALSADTAVAEALGRFFEDCMTHWLANQPALREGRDPEALHQMRVALRRLRSVATLFKEVLPRADSAWLQREAKALLRELGPARDWDVFCDETLPPLIAADPQDPGLQALDHRAATARQAAQVRAQTLLDAPRYTAFLLDLGAWIEARGWRGGTVKKGRGGRLATLAARRLDSRQRKVSKQGHGFDALHDADLHRLRIELKKLRYAAEFFAPLYPTDLQRDYLKALRRLQEDLGHLNDVAVARQLLAALPAEDPAALDGAEKAAFDLAAGRLIGWYDHALAQMRPRITEDWYAFAASESFWQAGPRQKNKLKKAKRQP